MSLPLPRGGEGTSRTGPQALEIGKQPWRLIQQSQPGAPIYGPTNNNIRDGKAILDQNSRDPKAASRTWADCLKRLILGKPLGQPVLFRKYESVERIVPKESFHLRQGEGNPLIMLAPCPAAGGMTQAVSLGAIG